LYVANGAGVEEKLRREERGDGKDLAMGAERGSRAEGMRKRRRIEMAIVGAGHWQWLNCFECASRFPRFVFFWD
jgi:hypothetical protein